MLLGIHFNARDFKCKTVAGQSFEEAAKLLCRELNDKDAVASGGEIPWALDLQEKMENHFTIAVAYASRLFANHGESRKNYAFSWYTENCVEEILRGRAQRPWRDH